MRAILVKVLKGKLSPKLFVLGGVFLAFGFIILGVWKPVFKAVVRSVRHIFRDYGVLVILFHITLDKSVQHFCFILNRI